MVNKEIAKQQIGFSWLLTMAWRDSRKNRSRLLLFISSIVLGIAALVAVYSFKDNLQRDIDQQAKELTGADLILESRKIISDTTLKSIVNLGDEQAQERSFASMVYFIKTGGTRLIQVKALQGKYPFYGNIETSPEIAGSTFQDGQKALVDQTLMLQYNAKVGDSIKIGELNFQIAGKLEKAPGQTGIAASVAPIVYIPLKYLAETGLTQIGSRITYRFYYQFRNAENLESTLKNLESKLEKEGLSIETVTSKKAETGKSFRDLSRFLSLAGFIALLLGCIGVGSAIHVYIQEKLSTIATLRCLGLKAKQAFLIYLIQIAIIGLIGAILGAVLGTLIQFALPLVLKDFLPVEITMQISWLAIVQGILLGLIISILFALPSLLAVRKISPLNAIRASFESQSTKRDPLNWLVYFLMVVFVFGFTYLQMKSIIQTIAFTFAILIALLLLMLLAKLLLFVVRKFLPESMSYLWRQGFANLYRPNNQTVMLTVAIGLSSTFICTLFLIQNILIQRVTLSSSANQPNMVMFDIQQTQKEDLNKLTKSYNLPLMNQVPIITMRIEEINGKKLGSDSSKRNESRGEIRATYQDTLTVAEKITEGVWTNAVETTPNAPIYVSLEQSYAKRIKVKLKDKILFNVQGMLIPTVVGSIREVNWASFQTNFRVVFPTGVLETAPQFFVLMTKIPSKEISAKYQSAVVTKFPNVSMIDLELILKLLDELLSKISFVIKFMAGFSMATGWIVLLSSVLTSKNQRIKESILLRTLGASRKQVLIINAVEYFFLGVFAAGAGLILALSASYLLAKFSFEASFSPPLAPIAILFGTVVSLVVITGVSSIRRILNQPPLKILTNEG